MKHILTILLSSSALFISLIGCKKGFLKEHPYSFLSSDAIYNSNSGADAVMIGAWGVAADYGGFGAGYSTMLNISSGGYWTSQAAASDLNSLTFGSSTLWLSNNSPWDAFYSSIKVCNDIIDKLPNATSSDSVKRTVTGEAYFLRGMLYFNLVRMFGGVPLRTKPVTIDEINLPRASKADVYALIISDLEKAKQMMVAPGKQPVGRPHKYAAGALLGKVYLTLASNDPASTYWQKAKDELLAVVNSGAYSLETNYSKLFDVNNENNKESIVEIQYTISGGPNGQWTNFYSPNGSTYTPMTVNGPFGRNRINKEIYDGHVAQYTNADPRIKVTYIDSFFTTNAGVVTRVYPYNNSASNAKSQGWPYIKKYIDASYVSTNSNRNFYYLRYADVLLMLAEAENEINGPTNAYQYVNMVLTRARLKPDGTSSLQPKNWDATSINSKDVFRDRIFLERRYELEGECHLWYDVRRRGQQYLKNFLTYHNTYPKFTVGADITYPVDDNSINRLMLLPIPIKEINASTAINDTDQNPGY